MSNVVITCFCLNIKIAPATKFDLDNIDDCKIYNAVKEPLSGYEIELGMDGVCTEFDVLTRSESIDPEWTTISCLNCNTNNLYSFRHSRGINLKKVVVHENAIYGSEYEKIKETSEYSKIFSIKLSKNDNPITIPLSIEVIPNQLIPSYEHIKSVLDQSTEQLYLESKNKLEEAKLQKQTLLIKSEADNLWTTIVNISRLLESEEKGDAKRVSTGNHNRFEKDREAFSISNKKLSFGLDEATISHLKNVKLDYQDTFLDSVEDDDDEDLFNMDEELSDEDDYVEKSLNIENRDINANRTNDLLLSTSLRKSISEIDQRFSWTKKKRATEKYISNDFDIKIDTTKETVDNKPLSLFATSVPITIHSPFNDDPINEVSQSPSSKKDILASSFANYDSSYSDRLLSTQFPFPPKKKNIVSSSLIRPQLDTLTSKSLDTRGLIRKNNQIELPESDDEFDSTLPPHVWAAIASQNDI